MLETPLRLDQTTVEEPLLAGVELGGTKCVVTLARGRQVVAQQRLATTRPEPTLSQIEALLDDWRAASPFAALGVACFGPLDLDPQSAGWGRIRATPKAHWAGADIRGRLASRYDCPIGFDTDVAAAALAEGRWGAAAGLRSHAYVTVGTGVGVGLVIEGRSVRGLGHVEAGHVRVRRMAGDAWLGSCPFHGDCVEGLASGTAIQARLGRPAGSVDARHEAWSYAADALAQMLHAILLIAAPERVLFGGGVILSQPHLLPRIRAAMSESLAGYGAAAEVSPEDLIRVAGLGAAAGPLGSIALAKDALAAADASLAHRKTGCGQG